jgi:hypothetical protein
MQPKLEKPMYRDPLTEAIYTQAERDEMSSNPIYANLIERLVLESKAPEPTDAKQLNDGNKVLGSAIKQDNGSIPK